MVVITEYSKVRDKFPEFQTAWNDTLAKARKDAQDAWGLTDGGLFPGANQFGQSPLRPRFFQIGTTGEFESWNRNLGTYGWQNVVDNSIIEDVYVGILGFVLPNVSQRISAIRLEAGKSKFPVINLQGEVDIMSEPAVVFEKGIVIPEEEAFLLRAHALTKGYNVIKPLGFALAKSKVLIAEKPT